MMKPLRAARSVAACTASSPSLIRRSSSTNRWLRNLPVVLLSSMARRAPATPSFSAGCSTSDSVDLVPATPR
ncbi:hypothetical protein ACVWW4_007824 [Bradyrhizobium sp. LB7.1]